MSVEQIATVDAIGIGIAPVFRTLSIGGKMISEVSDGEKSVCS
jgi:hypothetical protein